MTFEKHMSLREAEKLTGIGRQTLRLWLEQDLGLVFPTVSRGSKFLILEKDLEAVLKKREGRRKAAARHDAASTAAIDVDEMMRMSQEGNFESLYPATPSAEIDAIR
jgi:hypothetical protein